MSIEPSEVDPPVDGSRSISDSKRSDEWRDNGGLSHPPKKPGLRPVLVPLIVLAIVLASPFIIILAGHSSEPSQQYSGPHANLVAGDYLVWDYSISYVPGEDRHTAMVWNVTGSSDRSFTLHGNALDVNGSSEMSYWPHIGAAFSDSDNNVTPTIEILQTAFGDKRVYHYHCPERSFTIENGTATIPPSDTYIGVETNVVYQTVSYYEEGLNWTITLKETNAQSILEGDKP
jgi:hypothetical protein